MKKYLMMMMVSLLPISLMAQDDDMYFVPSKSNVAKEKKSYGLPRNTYYSGSSRSVDDYNRSMWQRPDSLSGDVVDFSAVHGAYTDSTLQMQDDYQYTQRMSRFDDYVPSEAYWEGYRDATRDQTSWHVGVSYYPWYDSWYYPWYDWYYYRPWTYYGWYGYYRWYNPRPWYYYGGYHPYHPSGHRGGVRDYRPTNHRPRNLGGSNYGGYRDNGRSSGSFSSGSNSNGRSFGGYRSSSGSSLGGGRSSGSSGGSVGGGRSASGGRSFGGKR